MSNIMSHPAAPKVVESITAFGQHVLLVGAIILGASSVFFLLASFREHAKLRVFHHITFLIVLVAALAYFAMSQGLGFVDVEVGDGTYRSLAWARYADWTITTPLLLLDLALLSGLSPVDTSLMIVADLGMIITGTIGALVGENEVAKWGFYVASCLFFAYVLYGLVIAGRKTAYSRSDAVGSAYMGISLFTVALWTAYPVVWALAEGSNMISADAEVLAYAVLDILAKSVFGFWLLGLHARIPEAQVAYKDSWMTSEQGILLSD